MIGKHLNELTALAEDLKSGVSKMILPFQDTRVNGAVRNDMAKAVFSKAIDQIEQAGKK